MCRQSNGKFDKAITDEDLAIYRAEYPKGGSRSVAKHFPGMSRNAITQTARRYGIRREFDGKPHGGSRGGGRPKKGAPEGRYVPSEAEQRRMEVAMQLFGPLRDFGVITRAGNLVPIIDARLAA